jgi:histidine triad (HIT) family protein
MDQSTHQNCLFCQLAQGQNLIWQNEDYAAFKDIHPKAPLHLLVVPKRHVEKLDDVPAEMAPGLIAAVQTVAREQGVAGAYHIEVNVGRPGGQEIDHLHVHLMSRRTPQ